MAGGKAYQLIPKKEVADPATYTSLVSVFNKKAYVLISAFNTDRVANDANTITLKIPKNELKLKINRIKIASITRENSIYDQMLIDTKKEGILNPKLKNLAFYIPNLKEMSTNRSQFNKLLKNNWDGYQALWKDALTLKEFKGSIKEDKHNYFISIKMVTPQSSVLLLE
jgi:hypothetical protein